MSAPERHPLLWSGVCTICLHETRIAEDKLLQSIAPLGQEQVQRVQIDGAFVTECPNCDADQLVISRTDIQAVPFSAWQVLPAPEGVCSDCGRDHEPDQPHDRQTMLYQYRFRSQEAQAGREERWPTWRDAMAHCTPDVQAAWIEELTRRGIDVDHRSN